MLGIARGVPGNRAPISIAWLSAVFVGRRKCQWAHTTIAAKILDIEENIMNIDVPPEFESFVASLVARRRFLSANEVLAESLRLLQARESLAEEVQNGFEQIDAGKCVDGPAALAKLRGNLANRSEQ